MSGSDCRSQGRVAVVTVTYGDRIAYLLQQARALAAEPAIAAWCIVANGALRQAQAAAHAYGGAAEVVELSGNLGSAAGFCAGIERILAAPAPEFLWLLDDDNVPGTGALEALRVEYARQLDEGAQRERLGLVSFRQNVHGALRRGAGRRPNSALGIHFVDLPGQIARRLLGWPRRECPLPATVLLNHAPYGGLFCHRALIDTIGLPDLAFVLYADDTEFTNRIPRCGGRLVLVTHSEVHDLEPSWWQRAPRRFSLLNWVFSPDPARVYYGARNETWFDVHRLARRPLVYRLNRWLLWSALRCTAVVQRRRDRFALLQEAFRAGEAGTLGPDPRFPLSMPSATASGAAHEDPVH